MRSIHAILVVAALAACGPVPAPSPASRVEGIMLQRLPCVSGCPAYRLALTRDGAVSFQSLHPGDSTTALDRISPAAFDALAREAERIDFWSFPDMILGHRQHCGSLPRRDPARSC